MDLAPFAVETWISNRSLPDNVAEVIRAFAEFVRDLPSIPTFGCPDTPLLMAAKPRNPAWEKESRAWLQTHNECEASGSKDNLTVHHVKPVHLYPELEMEPKNWMALCTDWMSFDLHRMVGHLGNWSHFNPHARELAASMRFHIAHVADKRLS